MIALINRQWEEPNGCGGGRQDSMDGTMDGTSRETQARLYERFGVKLSGATRRRSAMIVPTATQILHDVNESSPDSEFPLSSRQSD